jgi:hypothetical protein
LVSAILGAIPLGLGIALNPIAIVAGILILRTARPRLNGLAFAAGWVLGLILLVALSNRLVLLQTRGDRDALLNLPAIIWAAIGALLLLAALRAQRCRPLPGEEPEAPRWLGIIGRADLGIVELALTAAAFIAVSSIGILVPLLVRLFGGEGADATLAAWSTWLNRSVASITAGVPGSYLLVRGLMGVF